MVKPLEKFPRKGEHLELVSIKMVMFHKGEPLELVSIKMVMFHKGEQLRAS